MVAPDPTRPLRDEPTPTCAVCGRPEALHPVMLDEITHRCDTFREDRTASRHHYWCAYRLPIPEGGIAQPCDCWMDDSEPEPEPAAPDVGETPTLGQANGDGFVLQFVESAAPQGIAGDVTTTFPLCECGHAKRDHEQGAYLCVFAVADCNCNAYRAAPAVTPAPPSPPPTPLDVGEREEVKRLAQLDIAELNAAAQEYEDSAYACDTPALRPFRRRRNMRAIALRGAAVRISRLVAEVERAADDAARLTWALTRAKSALENWGFHHEWCATVKPLSGVACLVTDLPSCTCGYEQAIADALHSSSGQGAATDNG